MPASVDRQAREELGLLLLELVERHLAVVEALVDDLDELQQVGGGEVRTEVADADVLVDDIDVRFVTAVLPAVTLGRRLRLLGPLPLQLRETCSLSGHGVPSFR